MGNKKTFAHDTLRLEALLISLIDGYSNDEVSETQFDTIKQTYLKLRADLVQKGIIPYKEMAHITFTLDNFKKKSIWGYSRKFKSYDYE